MSHYQEKHPRYGISQFILSRFKAAPLIFISICILRFFAALNFNLTEEESKDLADVESFMSCEGGPEGDAG